MAYNDNVIFKTSTTGTIDTLLNWNKTTGAITAKTDIVPIAPGTVYFTADGHIIYDLDQNNRLWMGKNAYSAIYAEDINNSTLDDDISTATVYYGTCATGASTRAKVVTCPGFILGEGSIIFIKMTNAQTYNASSSNNITLNINNTGAINLKYIGTTQAPRYCWVAGEVISVIYDGTNYVMNEGGIASTTYYGVTKLATSATSTSTSLALTPASLYNFITNFVNSAPIYSASSLYEVGDMVRYNYNAYICNTAIETAEAWNEEHWTIVPTIQEQISVKAPIDSPNLTGTPTAPTPTSGDNSTKIATTAFVSNAISQGFAANDAMVFKGVIGSNQTITSLPTKGYSAGWTYRVADAGVFAGEYCEVGDLIIAIKDGPASGSSVVDIDWAKIEHNIDGAVFRGAGANNSSVGSGTQPVYVNSSGIVTPITSYSGNAATATKLATPRNLQVALSSTTAVTFDGSANQNNIPVSGVLAISHGGTGKTTALEAYTVLEDRGYVINLGSNDLNLAIDRGTYSYSSGCLNLPRDNSYGAIFNILNQNISQNNTDNWLWQLAVNTSTNNLYLRRKVNANDFSSWTTFFHNGHINNNSGLKFENDVLSIKIAEDSLVGGIKLGYIENNKKYAIKVNNSGQAYVEVPWENTTYSSKSAAQNGTDVSLVTTGEKYIWNNKQDALTAQTAYSAKGSSTKVAQITTNSLGQVTSISEVNIAFPTKSSWNYDDIYVKYSASQSLTNDQKAQARTNIGAGTSSLTIGTTASTAAAGNHTHTASLATDTGTSTITLAYGAKYKLTAGGQSIIFTMPSSDNTNTTYTFANGTGGTFKVTPSGGSAQTVKVGTINSENVVKTFNANTTGTSIGSVSNGILILKTYTTQSVVSSIT